MKQRPITNRWLRALWHLFLVVIGLPLLYLLCALVLGLIPVHADHEQPAEGVDIYVSTNGAHADLVVPSRSPLKDWFELFPPEQFQKVDTSFQYIAFGWGERNFYLNTPTWDDLTADVAIHALFWPSASAMHVDVLQRIPPANENYVRIRITEQQYHGLVQHILSGFQWDEAGRPLLIEGANYWSADNFFEAKGEYHLFKTSNTWTAKGLKSIGVRTAVWSPFDKAIMYHARRLK